MKHRSLIVILASLSMLGALCIDAYLPSLPAIAAQFSVSVAAAQQTLTIYLFGFAFMMLFYGVLSDSFGRRPVILGSMFLYVASSVGAVFAPGIGWLLFFRLCQGLSAGAGSVVGRAVVGDCFQGAEAQRILSYISMVFGIAPAVAPILGGWLQAAFGWRSVFGFIALFGIVLLIACLRGLPETLPPERRHAFHFRVIVRNYWEVGRHLRFLLQSTAIALAFSGVMFHVGAAPSFVMTILHLPVTAFGWLFVPLIGGMTLGSFAAGWASHRWAPRVTIGLGFAVMTVGALADWIYAAGWTVRIPWVVIPLFVYAFGVSLAVPAMTVETLELFPTMRGLAASLQGFTFMILFAVGSGVVCPFLFGSARRFALAVVFGLVASAACWVLGRKLREETCITH